MDDIDLIAACLENAIGGAGGFCVGKKYIVDHQVCTVTLVINSYIKCYRFLCAFCSFIKN